MGCGAMELVGKSSTRVFVKGQVKYMVKPHRLFGLFMMN